MERRVVVTGMGTVNPLGNSLAQFWDGLSQGRSGIGPITKFDCSDHATKVAAEIKHFEVGDFLDLKDAKKMEPFSHYAVASALQAWSQAGLESTNIDPTRAGCVLGVGIGGFETLEVAYERLAARGPRRVPPMTVPKLISNIGPGNISIILNLQGPSYSLATACASGTDAIGHSFLSIKHGLADVMVTGGVEAIITSLGIAGFNVIHALSTRYNDEPTRASRPFDKDRDGFVMGEAAGILILEDLEHAQERGAHIYGELVGFGSSTDANHLTAPHPEARGAIIAMERALKLADLQPQDIDYINAHGTGTPVNDPIETKAIKRVFGDHAHKLKVSSTKSMTGHCIGAAGAIEAIASIKAINHSIVPPTINLETPDPNCDLDYVPNTAIEHRVRTAMSNSLGFGGHNSFIIFEDHQHRNLRYSH